MGIYCLLPIGSLVCHKHKHYRKIFFVTTSTDKICIYLRVWGGGWLDQWGVLDFAGGSTDNFDLINGFISFFISC
jgi:hypothetical protein